MSTHVGYFFATDLSLSDLATEVDSALGCVLRHPTAPGEPYSSTLFSMSLQLSEHGYSNDGDLDLESFRYELDLHTQWAAAHRRTVQVPALLMAAAVLQTHLGVGGLVVWDLGTLLARYEPRRSRHAGHAAAGTQVAVDVLSGTSPEDFPAHLAAVLCRMPG